ncbi:PIN domain-containing protein [Umezawaea sp. Da 62-37]|uniref:PIN domain-containing protein n=1 Tax=Umezawaea sp. Da 62-37 TaxID=3075927 RepID=UPI0028F6F9E0|nr:PIN domain-containing protein [Umezawaea sp. Da 62-37]WNV90377.1 PIN domain-containing protein [Umezawaea sp. Da 62-37]
MFSALLDTCVLWPSLQRDFLLSLGIEGMYRPLWSTAILDELEYEEARKLVERGEEPTVAARRARRLVTVMRQAFDDAEVRGWEGLDGAYGLPDPDDEHVVAASVVGGAGAIVTHNVKDFPEALVPKGIQVLLPSQFAADTVALSPTVALIAVEAIASRSGRFGSSRSVPEILDTIDERYGMTQAVALIRPLL